MTDSAFYQMHLFLVFCDISMCIDIRHLPACSDRIVGSLRRSCQNRNNSLSRSTSHSVHSRSNVFTQYQGQ